MLSASYVQCLSWQHSSQLLLFAGPTGATGLMGASRTVLAAGGLNGPPLASSNVYNPVNKTWALTTGPMTTARSTFQMVLLSDGTVLAAGGLNGSPMASSEVYNPVTKTWAITTTPMTTARSALEMVLLSDGTTVAAGGYDVDSDLASSEVYNPVTKTWALTAGPMTTARSFFQMVLLSDSTVLVAGGQNGNNKLASSEVYNPVTKMWAVTARDGQTLGFPSGLGIKSWGSGESSGSARKIRSAATNFPGMEPRFRIRKTRGSPEEKLYRRVVFRVGPPSATSTRDGIAL